VTRECLTAKKRFETVFARGGKAAETLRVLFLIASRGHFATIDKQSRRYLKSYSLQEEK
jgi:hypothetical protein